MDRSWDWQRNYRVWEANRRVFVYPENWIEPDQRMSPHTQAQVLEVVKVAHGQRSSVLLTSATAAAGIVAGRALAANLGRDLYFVDLKEVVSKYIGETEKNLNRIFAAADQARAVLLLDESDALFGKRSDVADSHDRVAGVEVRFLLDRIEAFEGLAILATNSTRETVEPLLRRFPFVIQPVADKS